MLVSRFKSEVIARSQRCANCWSHLVVYATGDPLLDDVHCATPGCPCNGFVGRHWVDLQLAKSRMELWLAKESLTPFLPWATVPDKTPEQINKELGFDQKEK